MKCKIMEDMGNESLKEGAINTARQMKADGMLALEKMLNMLDNLLTK